MNSMFSVWTLSSLILSYTLAFPIFNNTSKGSYMETFPNVTEIMKHNNTRLVENMETFANISELQERRSRDDLHIAGCPLTTCGLHRLSNSLQTGDEKAGNYAQDAWGPGKK